MRISNETLFAVCNTAVLPGWILLLVAPAWRWTQRIAMFTIPLLLAFVYLVLFIVNFEGFHAILTTFGALQYLFHRPGAILAAWVHLLALDLFVGAWMVRDALRLKLLHLAVIPCLLVTYVFGPVGLLIYIPLRAGLKRGPVSYD